MSARAQPAGSARTRGSPLIATCAPGLTRLLRDELKAGGAEVTGTGSDGRSGLLFLSAGRTARTFALATRLAEDVFAEIGRAARAGADAATLAAALWQPDAAERALSVWAQEVRPLAGTMTFRVTATVLSERPLRRADLRQAVTAVIAGQRPRWRPANPAQLEFRVSEWHDGQYALGLRLTGAQNPGGGEAPRPGTLRRSVAAAMVALAGPPRGVLLDPCCGPGAILAEAAMAGWTAEGTDIDPGAVREAGRAAPRARVELGDAREILLPDASIAACVSELPSGRQSPAGPASPAWILAVLHELSRVTRTGGTVVLLGPELPRPGVPPALRLRRQVPVTLPRGPARISVLHRA